MRKLLAAALVLVTFLAALPMDAGAAEGFVDYIEAMPCYHYIDRVDTDLSFSGDYAVCSGSIAPLNNEDVSLVVTLYRLANERWEYITSWTGSATSGLTAYAGGQALVASGTYKLTVTGNVGDLEYPTKSVIRAK